MRRLTKMKRLNLLKNENMVCLELWKFICHNQVEEVILSGCRLTGDHLRTLIEVCPI